MSALLELAERCEAATGPDRELDAGIARTQGWTEYERAYGSGWTRPDGQNAPGGWNDLPSFTASLDAALTLVPEGWETAIYLGGELANVQMETEAMRQRIDFELIDGTAATPALALCAAALRARAAGEGA